MCIYLVFTPPPQSTTSYSSYSTLLLPPLQILCIPIKTGTLIISLGSQEIAKGVVSGVEMTASDRFYEGDNVHFGDGTQGYIQKMGKLLCWL